MVNGILKHSKLEELLNAEDKNGNTALHLASTKRHALVLCSLTLGKRVDLKRKNEEGLTALDIAIDRQKYSSLRQVC